MLAEINLAETSWKLIPSSTAEEILQNVKCLLLTAKGTCWNYRDFGIDVELIDKPLPVAKNKFLSEVVRAVAKFEPRAKVKKIRWTGDAAAGQLNPILEVELNGN